MLLDGKVTIKWTSNNKEFYESKGYKYTKTGKLFEVNVSDLSLGTSAKVKVKCDICNVIYEVNYSNYVRKKKDEDCCKKGRHCQEYYDNIYKSYDCELLENFKDNNTKIEFICFCGENSVKTFYEFIRNPGCKKCNKEKHFENMRKALKRNGFVPTSRQQIYIYNLIDNVELNYLVKYYFLDIAFLEEKIYIEYDGGLHDGAVKFGALTEKEFEHKQFIRSNFLFKNGWKEIRIISKDDLLPTKDEIISFISYAKNYLNTGRHWIHLDIDESKIRCSQFEKEIKFNKLEYLKEKIEIEDKFK